MKDLPTDKLFVQILIENNRLVVSRHLLSISRSIKNVRIRELELNQNDKNKKLQDIGSINKDCKKLSNKVGLLLRRITTLCDERDIILGKENGYSIEELEEVIQDD